MIEQKVKELEIDLEICKLTNKIQKRLLQKCCEKLTRMGTDYDTAHLVKQIEKHLGES